MAKLMQKDSHEMDLHHEQLAGRTQQVFFSAEESENFTYPGAFDVLHRMNQAFFVGLF